MPSGPQNWRRSTMSDAPTAGPTTSVWRSVEELPPQLVAAPLSTAPPAWPVGNVSSSKNHTFMSRRRAISSTASTSRHQPSSRNSGCGRASRMTAPMPASAMRSISSRTTSTGPPFCQKSGMIAFGTGPETASAKPLRGSCSGTSGRRARLDTSVRRAGVPSGPRRRTLPARRRACRRRPSTKGRPRPARRSPSPTPGREVRSKPRRRRTGCVRTRRRR